MSTFINETLKTPVVAQADVVVMGGGPAGVKPLTHTIAVGARVKKGNITSVQVKSKSGRGAILGKVFVDSTGDGDSAVWCDVSAVDMKQLRTALIDARAILE